MSASRPHHHCLRTARVLLSGAVSVLLAAVASGQHPEKRADFPIPMTLVEEHAEFHSAVESAVRAEGPLGTAAEDLLALLNPHFEKEQRYALATLWLLPALARGQVTPDMAEWVAASDSLRAEIDTLVREHRAIARALNRLSETAWSEGHPAYAFLAARMLRHIRMEEEILYPGALLVGDYLRLRLAVPTTGGAGPTSRNSTR